MFFSVLFVFLMIPAFAFTSCVSIDKALPAKEAVQIGPVEAKYKTFQKLHIVKKDKKIAEARVKLTERAKALYGRDFPQDTIDVSDITIHAAFSPITLLPILVGNFQEVTASGTVISNIKIPEITLTDEQRDAMIAAAQAMRPPATPAPAPAPQQPPVQQPPPRQTRPAPQGTVTPLAPPDPAPQPQPQQQPVEQAAPVVRPSTSGANEHFFIFFEAYTAKLTGEGLTIPELHDVSTTLNTVRQVLKDNPDYQLLIEGFANPVTNTKIEEPELQRLSSERAKETETWFVRDGVGRERLITIGEGGISDNRTQRAKNRRVQLTVIKPQAKVFPVQFVQNHAALISREFYAQDQIDSLRQIRDVVDYVKANPGVRLLVRGYEGRQERKSGGFALSKLRADEVTRLLRRELRKETLEARVIVAPRTGIRDTITDVIVLEPLPASIP
ncbi:MAG: OmpA family protein [Spirochaetaceae bacterium]|jgi:outer membrane protein OmpA-like peptidoglycan-associated protein|nr:OmpA family protein [Spirochaetaceae bacterium]